MWINNIVFEFSCKKKIYKPRKQTFFYNKLRTGYKIKVVNPDTHCGLYKYELFYTYMHMAFVVLWGREIEKKIFEIEQ